MVVIDGGSDDKIKVMTTLMRIDENMMKSVIGIGNYTVREVLMKNRTRVWRNVYNTASA